MAYVPPGSYSDHEMSLIQGMQDQIMKVIQEKFVDTQITPMTPILIRDTIKSLACMGGLHSPEHIKMEFECSGGNIDIFPLNLYTALILNGVIGMPYREVLFKTETTTHSDHRTESIEVPQGTFTMTTYYYYDLHPCLTFTPNEPASYISVTFDLPKEEDNEPA